MSLVAIADNIRAWSIADIAVAIVIILIVLGIVFLVSKETGFVIPQWFWKILGLCVLGVIAVFAIRFVASM